MTISQFAEKYRLKRLPAGKPSKRCNNLAIETAEDVIEGKCGFIGEGWSDSQVDGRMIVHLLAVPRPADMNKKLASRTRLLEQAGLTLKVKSGYESEWYLDTAVEAHVQAAIEAVEPRRVKTYSDAARKAISERLKPYRRGSGEKLPCNPYQSATLAERPSKDGEVSRLYAV